MDAKDITTSITATGSAPDGSTPSKQAQLVQTTTGENALEVTKATPGTSELTRAGQEITYVITAKNNGDQTLSKLSIEDVDFTGHGKLEGPKCSLGGQPAEHPAQKLAPGAVLECVYTYVVTQADLDQGGITNAAHAEGTDPDGVVVEGESTAENGGGSKLPTKAESSLEVTKSSSTPSVVKVGQKIDYTVTVKNTGNLSVKDLEVQDVDFTGTGKLEAPVCADGKVENGALAVAPGTTISCVFTYTVTQADLDAGSISNAAKAAGKDVMNGDDVADTTDEPTTVAVENAGGLTVTKKASKAELKTAGERITYTITAKNTGNLTLNAVSVKDTEFTGTGELSEPNCSVGTSTVANGEAALKPGQSVVCVYVYSTTREDVLAGKISNAAEGTGTTPGGDKVTDVTDKPTVVENLKHGALTVTKTASTDRVVAAGEKITYTITVKNTGAGSVLGVKVADTGFTGRGSLSELSCQQGESSVVNGAIDLAAGDSVSCTTQYTVVREDLTGAPLSNGARAEGHGPDGTGIHGQTPGGAKVATVVPAQPQMPSTGAQVVGLLIGSAALVLLGLLFLVWRRPRRRGAHSA